MADLAIALSEEDQKRLRDGAAVFVDSDPDVLGGKRLLLMAERLDPDFMTALSDFVDTWNRKSNFQVKKDYMKNENLRRANQAKQTRSREQEVPQSGESNRTKELKAYMKRQQSKRQKGE